MTSEEPANEPSGKRRRILRIAAVLLGVLLLLAVWLFHDPGIKVSPMIITGPGAGLRVLVRVREVHETLREQDRLHGADWLNAAVRSLPRRKEGDAPGQTSTSIARRILEAIGRNGFILFSPTDDGEDDPPILMMPCGSRFDRIVRWFAFGAWKDEDGVSACRWVDDQGRASSLKAEVGGWLVIPLGARSDAALNRAITEVAKVPSMEFTGSPFGNYGEVIAPGRLEATRPSVDGFIRPQSFEGMESLADYPLLGFRQTAPTLGSWEVRLGSPEAMRETSLASLTPLKALPRESSSAPPESEVRSPVILQVDATREFVKRLADRTGVDLIGELERLKDNDWIRPGLAQGLQDALSADPAPTLDSRIGFALRPTTAEAVPVAESWVYPSSLLEGMDTSPAEALHSETPLTGLKYQAYGRPIYPHGGSRQNLARRFFALGWVNSRTAHSGAYAAIDWHELAESMAAFPAITLKKGRRDGWLDSTAIAETLASVLGVTTLRVEENGSCLIIWIDCPI